VGRFIKGEVVVIPFPFTNFSQYKRRPALVLAPLIGDDLILCMITSQVTRDADAILLRKHDFTRGTLNRESYIRPNRLITADDAIVIKSVGLISTNLTQQVLQKLFEILAR
jgi:mRNA interferase MazF